MSTVSWQTTSPLELPEAKFLKRQPRYKYWDGMIHLYSPGTGELYGGLLSHLKEWCRERQYAIQYEDNDWMVR